MKLRMIGMEQLKVETSTVLDAVEQGNACIVTRRGKASALLISARHAEEMIRRSPEIVTGLFDPDAESVQALASPPLRKKAS